jgi:radical SAM protein with 4Fe4S-binding SPASM domain
VPGLVTSLRGAIQRQLTWRRHQLRLQRLTREHPLRYLFLEVTRQCNLACQYCGSDCSAKSRDGELTTDEWLGVVQQVASDFVPSKVMVAVTGGEPLLKDGILRLFKELRALGFPYGMVTNGWLLTPEVARGLVDAGMGSISLSMDAPPEVNDRLRGKGSSDRVAQAVQHLQDAGFKGKLEVISTITTPAIPYLDAMRRLIAQMRVPLWRVAPVMPIGRAAQRPDLVPGPREVRQLLEYVRASRADGLAPTPEFCEEGFLGDRFEGVVRPYLSQCRAGITTGGVLSHGAIGACPELGEAYAQGDIRTERFKEVWDTRYQVLRDRSWTRHGVCADCGHYRQCGGGSLHLYHQPGADILRCLYKMAKEGGGEA